MSNRTLLEINHDHWMELCRPGFVHDLIQYLASGDANNAERLAKYGITFIAMRHHSNDFHIPPGTDGFARETASP